MDNAHKLLERAVQRFIERERLVYLLDCLDAEISAHVGEIPKELIGDYIERTQEVIDYYEERRRDEGL